MFMIRARRIVQGQEDCFIGSGFGLFYLCVVRGSFRLYALFRRREYKHFYTFMI
jgi:hypothetical protein